MRRLILFLLVSTLFLIGIVEAQVTGKYKVTYSDVTELTDTLQLDFADTISNATVTFTGKGFGSGNFDNSGGGTWKKWAGFTFTAATTEYAQYKLVISGTTWELYNSQGSLEGSGSVTDFWSLVNSDGSDIRVFNQSGDQLYFWIESFDYTNQKATIWVNISAGSTELNIAYGNPSALPSSYNDHTQVFYVVDDFEDGTTSDWTIVEGSASLWTADAAYVKFGSYSGHLSDTSTSARQYVMKAFNPQTDDFVISYWVYVASLSASSDYDKITLAIRDGASNIVGRVSIEVSPQQFLIGGAPTATAPLSLGTWYKIEMFFRPSSQTYDVRITDESGNVVADVSGIAFEISPSDISQIFFGSWLNVVSEVYFDHIVILKLADPAGVSSFQTGGFEVVNPKLILNGNVIEYQDNLTSGQSVTLSISASYFITGTNNVTITSDNKAVMDVVIEFDYAFTTTATITDQGYYITKTATITIPDNTVSATFTLDLPLRTADYILEVTGPSYTTTNLTDTVRLTFSLTPGTYSITATAHYLLFDIYFYDESTLNQASVNVTIQNSNYLTLNSYTDVNRIKIYGDDNYGYDRTYFLKITSGSTKSVYDRTVAIRTNQLNTTVKILVLDVNDPAVNVVFQLNDQNNVYSQGAVIRVIKNVNNETYEVVSDKIDSQGKISAILKHNEKYFISVLDWATWQEAVVGEYIASASETKIITPSGVTLSNVTTVFDYISYTVYDTTDAVVVHYEDRSAKTNSITVTIFDDKGNVVFNQTSYQQTYDVVYYKNETSTYYSVYIRADTQYGLIEDMRIVGSPTGLLSDVITLLPGEDVTGYPQDFMMAAISFIIMLFFAALFSKRNSRTGALVTAIGAGMIWVFGWLPVDAGIIALVIFLAILGKYEEGYRK
jgi:hypothetical protein